MATINRPNQFDPETIEFEIETTKSQLDEVRLTDTDKEILNWIPEFFQDPLEQKHAYKTLLKRATGKLKRPTEATTVRMDIQPAKEAE